jgi:hypothetical protein
MRYLYNHHAERVAFLSVYDGENGRTFVYVNFFEKGQPFDDTSVEVDVFKHWKDVRGLYEVTDLNDDQKQMDIFDF